MHQFNVTDFMKQILMEHELCARFWVWCCKRLTMEDGKAKVIFDVPQRAITPGQAVVFYEIGGANVIGGGIIE